MNFLCCVWPHKTNVIAKLPQICNFSMLCFAIIIFLQKRNVQVLDGGYVHETTQEVWYEGETEGRMHLWIKKSPVIVDLIRPEKSRL